MQSSVSMKMKNENIFLDVSNIYFFIAYTGLNIDRTKIDMDAS